MRRGLPLLRSGSLVRLGSVRSGEGGRGGEGLDADVWAERTACDRVFLWERVGFSAVRMTRRLSPKRGQCRQRWDGEREAHFADSRPAMAR